MELALIKHIKEHGLTETAEKFSLTVKDYGHKILIKYSQIDSPFSEKEVCEARGIILEKDTLKIMSLPFVKFFNAAEFYAAKIDWATANVFEKLDGSLMQLYFDWIKNEWCVGTSGTAEAEGEVNNRLGTTFADLFWKSISVKGGKFASVIKNHPRNEWSELFNEFLCKDTSYVFELTTPENIVVTPHKEYKVTLLAVRKLDTLKELSKDDLESLSIELDVNLVKCFDFKDTDDEKLTKTLENMPFSEEGYVVCDANFNRVKIKNPAYLAVHHLKDKNAEYRIMGIIKSNEVDEFIATFPDRAEEIYDLQTKYLALKNKLKEVWNILKDSVPTDKNDKIARRDYALNLMKVVNDNNVKDYSGLYFALADGKQTSIDDYLFNYDDKVLYKAL